MELISEMKGADSNTKLLLLTWAACIGSGFHSGANDVFAQRLHTTKNHVSKALKYCVTEGYIWRIKSQEESPVDGGPKIRFGYGLSQETNRLWLEIVSHCRLKDELICALMRTSIVDRDNSATSVKITENMRLVWVVLLVLANGAGYVVGTSNQSLCNLLGLTEETVRRSLSGLVRTGILSIAAKGVARTELLAPLSPIYKIHPQQFQRKKINFGLSTSNGNLTPFRFLTQLSMYYRKARKHRKTGRYPIQGSLLPDERYFELSKIFSNKQLARSTEQLCLSIILSYVPVFASDLRSGGEVRVKAIETLRTKLIETLSDTFSITSLSICEQGSAETDTYELSEAEKTAGLRAFTLDALTNELTSLIEDVSRSWSLLTDFLGQEVLLIDYRPKKHMYSVGKLLLDAPIEGFADSNDDAQSKGGISNDNYQVSNVFTALVPNKEHFDDCMVIFDRLLTVNAGIKHPNVIEVGEIYCS